MIVSLGLRKVKATGWETKLGIYGPQLVGAPPWMNLLPQQSDGVGGQHLIRHCLSVIAKIRLGQEIMMQTIITPPQLKTKRSKFDRGKISVYIHYKPMGIFWSIFKLLENFVNISNSNLILKLACYSELPIICGNHHIHTVISNLLSYSFFSFFIKKYECSSSEIPPPKK